MITLRCVRVTYDGMRGGGGVDVERGRLLKEERG